MRVDSRTTAEQAEEGLHRRSVAIGAPAVLWLMVFFLIPLGMVAVASLLTAGDYGGIEPPVTFANYLRIAGKGMFGFDPVYPLILGRSLLLGLVTTVLCLAAGLPLAFWIARLPGAFKTLGLTLVVVPFWTNLLIRTYAWQILLSPDGWVTGVARWVGLVDPGAALYPGMFAVSLCMLCDFLPFMVLPLYVSIEKLDTSLVEAAADLGANRWNIFRHAIVPQIRSGLAAGVTLVFLPATGQFVIPDLLGGGKTALLGNLIQQQFGPSMDWPFGSAIAMVTLVVVLLGLWVASLMGGQRGETELL